ncbi:MAG: hypothetical protein Q9196_001566 [Gyalolechia fulgens]
MVWNPFCPYAPAVFRFIVSLPPRYPETPPLITFVTDVFHPLVTPLTTYTYTTGSPSSDPVSATDEERLPPGGFGLSHAFPHWFSSTGHSVASSVHSSRNVGASVGEDVASENGICASEEPGARPLPGQRGIEIAIIKVLDYVKRSFDEETILDALPLKSAANPGAWKAWRAHRHGALQCDGNQKAFNDQSSLTQTASGAQSTQATAKHQDEWSWEGVWRERVKRGIDASISDQVLFGAGGGDEIVGLELCQLNQNPDLGKQIRFNDIQEDNVCAIKEVACHIAM